MGPFAFRIIIDTTNASLPTSGPRRSLRDEAEGLEHPFQGLESLRLWQPVKGIDCGHYQPINYTLSCF